MNAPGFETVAQRIVRALLRHKVKNIFGQSLPSAVILAGEAAGIRQIAYRQENAGGAMADGFARVSGQVGVVTAQNGPAATLLVAPLAEALKASIPVVALVQDVERPHMDRNAFQDLDHIALFQPCAKWVRRVLTADRVDDYVDAAFVAAASGRPGPAVLLLPADLLREAATDGSTGIVRRESLGTWPLDRQRPSQHAIDAAADLIAEAQQPVVIAGGGVPATGASRVLSRLQEAAHLPIFSTFMGKGSVDERHPLSCGVLGALIGPRSIGFHNRVLLDEADVVLLVGTRTNQNGTDSWRLIPPRARVIHVDVDPMEVGRNYEAHRLTGDAAETLSALTEALECRDLTRRKRERAGLERRISAAWASFESDRLIHTASNQAPIRPERVMTELQRCLTTETTVVADASYSSMWIVGQLRCLEAGMRFLVPRGIAGLGWGLPMAIGAQIARPGKRVVAVVGDGGFGHSWAELETLVRHRLPITVIVLNNGVLGYQKDAETVSFGAFTTACRFAPVDHAAIALACGCSASRIVKAGDILFALEEALKSDRPYLLDVISDPDAHPPLSLYSKVDMAQMAKGSAV